MLRNCLLKTNVSIFNQVPTRSIISRHDLSSWKEEDGQTYGLVTYYPRHRDHKDPPIEPTKLLMVERVKSFKGNPWWEKDIMIQLKIDQPRKKKQIAIVKNTPEMCLMLWKIKHLIKVTPIHLPDNYYEMKDSDKYSTYLHEHGKLLVFPKIDEVRYKASEEFIKNEKRLDGDTLAAKLRLSWLNAMNFDRLP